MAYEVHRWSLPLYIRGIKHKWASNLVVLDPLNPQSGLESATSNERT